MLPSAFKSPFVLKKTWSLAAVFSVCSAFSAQNWLVQGAVGWSLGAVAGLAISALVIGAVHLLQRRKRIRLSKIALQPRWVGETDPLHGFESTTGYAMLKTLQGYAGQFGRPLTLSWSSYQRYWVSHWTQTLPNAYRALLERSNEADYGRREEQFLEQLTQEVSIGLLASSLKSGEFDMPPLMEWHEGWVYLRRMLNADGPARRLNYLVVDQWLRRGGRFLYSMKSALFKAQQSIPNGLVELAQELREATQSAMCLVSVCEEIAEGLDLTGAQMAHFVPKAELQNLLDAQDILFKTIVLPESGEASAFIKPEWINKVQGRNALQVLDTFVKEYVPIQSGYSVDGSLSRGQQIIGFWSTVFADEYLTDELIDLCVWYTKILVKEQFRPAFLDMSLFRRICNRRAYRIQVNRFFYEGKGELLQHTKHALKLVDVKKNGVRMLRVQYKAILEELNTISDQVLIALPEPEEGEESKTQPEPDLISEPEITTLFPVWETLPENGEDLQARWKVDQTLIKAWLLETADIAQESFGIDEQQSLWRSRLKECKSMIPRRYHPDKLTSLGNESVTRAANEISTILLPLVERFKQHVQRQILNIDLMEPPAPSEPRPIPDIFRFQYRQVIDPFFHRPMLQIKGFSIPKIWYRASSVNTSRAPLKMWWLGHHKTILSKIREYHAFREAKRENARKYDDIDCRDKQSLLERLSYARQRAGVVRPKIDQILKSWGRLKTKSQSALKRGSLSQDVKAALQDDLFYIDAQLQSRFDQFSWQRFRWMQATVSVLVRLKGEQRFRAACLISEAYCHDFEACLRDAAGLLTALHPRFQERDSFGSATQGIGDLLELVDFSGPCPWSYHSWKSGAASAVEGHASSHDDPEYRQQARRFESEGRWKAFLQTGHFTLSESGGYVTTQEIHARLGCSTSLSRSVFNAEVGVEFDPLLSANEFVQSDQTPRPNIFRIFGRGGEEKVSYLEATSMSHEAEQNMKHALIHARLNEDLADVAASLDGCRSILPSYPMQCAILEARDRANRAAGFSSAHRP